MQEKPLLEIENLTLAIGQTPIIEAVSLAIMPGEMVGLVGESGSGKSLSALSIMGLLPTPPIDIMEGSVRYQGQELTTLDETAMRALRGEEIAMIFQEPMSALNPVFTIGQQIRENILLHRKMQKNAANKQVIDLLKRVGIPSPVTMLRRYPHQLSGGQRQRVMIAMALACAPKLLIADEPSTALDVTIQAQILNLIARLRLGTGMAVLLITHDLGVVSNYCDRVAVMYLGRLVEYAKATAIFAQPRHRYTAALMGTIPAANPPGQPLPAIAGNVPQPADRPQGCAFHPRCPAALEKCGHIIPPLAGSDHKFACWNPL